MLPFAVLVTIYRWSKVVQHAYKQRLLSPMSAERTVQANCANRDELCNQDSCIEIASTTQRAMCSALERCCAVAFFRVPTPAGLAGSNRLCEWRLTAEPLPSHARRGPGRIAEESQSC